MKRLYFSLVLLVCFASPLAAQVTFVVDENALVTRVQVENGTVVWGGVRFKPANHPQGGAATWTLTGGAPQEFDLAATLGSLNQSYVGGINRNFMVAGSLFGSPGTASNPAGFFYDGAVSFAAFPPGPLVGLAFKGLADDGTAAGDAGADGVVATKGGSTTRLLNTVDAPDISATGDLAVAISNDGLPLLFSRSGGTWSSTAVVLPDLQGGGDANGISELGTFIVGAVYDPLDNNIARPAVWRLENGAYVLQQLLLDPDGGSLIGTATRATEAGMVVGFAAKPGTFEPYGFVWRVGEARVRDVNTWLTDTYGLDLNGHVITGVYDVDEEPGGLMAFAMQGSGVFFAAPSDAPTGNPGCTPCCQKNCRKKCTVTECKTVRGQKVCKPKLDTACFNACIPSCEGLPSCTQVCKPQCTTTQCKYVWGKKVCSPVVNPTCMNQCRADQCCPN